MEKLPRGPSGIFRVRGGYVIPDNVRGVIVMLDREFKVTREIDVRNDAQEVSAVTSDGDDIVALYAGYAANGLNIWEAAGEPYARVVYRFTSWSYLSGYYSWRSLTSCN